MELLILALASPVSPTAPVDIVPWIPAIAAIGAAIAAGGFALRNANRDRQARQAPSWAELVAENRLLRADLRSAATELRDATTRSDAERRDHADLAQKYSDLNQDHEDLREEFREFREEVSARDRAFGRVLNTAAAAWPTNIPGPVFSSEDLDILEDTLPDIPWLHRRTTTN